MASPAQAPLGQKARRGSPSLYAIREDKHIDHSSAGNSGSSGGEERLCACGTTLKVYSVPKGEQHMHQQQVPPQGNLEAPTLGAPLAKSSTLAALS